MYHRNTPVGGWPCSKIFAIDVQDYTLTLLMAAICAPRLVSDIVNNAKVSKHFLTNECGRVIGKWQLNHVKETAAE